MSCAGSIRGRGLGDPSVLCEAQQRRPGRLAADPGQQGQAAGVGLHGAAEGVQSEEAQDVEDAAIGGAASAGPAAGGRVGALLDVAHVRGDRVGATVERGIVPDAVDPALVDQATAAINGVDGITDVRELRIRWIGHTLRAEADVTVDPHITLTQAHDLAHHAEAHLLDQVRRLTAATIHASPAGAHHPGAEIHDHSRGRTT